MLIVPAKKLKVIPKQESSDSEEEESSEEETEESSEDEAPTPKTTNNAKPTQTAKLPPKQEVASKPTATKQPQKATTPAPKAVPSKQSATPATKQSVPTKKIVTKQESSDSDSSESESSEEEPPKPKPNTVAAKQVQPVQATVAPPKQIPTQNKGHIKFDDQEETAKKTDLKSPNNTGKPSKPITPTNSKSNNNTPSKTAIQQQDRLENVSVILKRGTNSNNNNYVNNGHQQPVKLKPVRDYTSFPLLQQKEAPQVSLLLWLF